MGINKKLNTALLLIVATIFCLLVMIVAFVAPFYFYMSALRPYFSTTTEAIVFVLCMVLSIVVTYFLYAFIMKQFMKKVDMDKYFDPIFRRK